MPEVMQVYDTVKKEYVSFTVENGILRVPGTWDYGTYPEFQGIPVNINVNSSQTIILNNIVGYHYGQLVITLGTLDTLVVQARMSDGTTVGIMTATGPAATKVALNSTQLVPANNGLYTLDRFDCYDILLVYTKSTGPLSVQGRLSAG